MLRTRLTCSMLAAAMVAIGASLAAADDVRTGPTTLPDGGAAKLMLAKGDRVVVIGDSITEQRLYSRFIEDYLVMCAPQLDLWVFQLGWGGETAGGFLGRFDSDLTPLKPTVITTCYGMNDAGYRAFEPGIGKGYYDTMSKLIAKARSLGAIAVVGSPGAVDSATFRGDAKAAAVYNDSLARLGELDRKIASEQGQVFGTIHDPMMKAMAAAKATLGANVPVCGGDGVHPGPNGSLVMAYAFLKAMGFDGNLGTITVDMTGQAEATDGHKVLSAKDGTVELESTRYPFCFPADQKDPSGERSILPYLPFNQDLNQLTLVVKNLKADNATVTWGKASKTFSKDQLTKGVNLAAEFLDNPFAETWAKVDGAVAAKENFETAITHNYTRALAGWAALLGDDPEAAAAIKVLQGKLMTRHEPLREAVGKARVPVKHTLVISAK